MNEKKRVMIIAAHPDDCEINCGGIAVKYLKLGYAVKFLSACNGSCGHHEMTPYETAKRRYLETRKIVDLTGIEYEVWSDVNDCELEANLANRKRMIRCIRKFKPDIIFCCRPNDYHADHKNVSMLVQDSAYLLSVPHFCSDTPAIKAPVIMHTFDRFTNPPFKADIIIDIDDVIDEKYELLNCHVSQVYEWLPFENGIIDDVPKDPEERLKWLREPRIPRDKPIDKTIMTGRHTSLQNEYRYARATVEYRDLLIERYGEKGKNTFFSEAFAVCEYGAALDNEKIKVLFPF